MSVAMHNYIVNKSDMKQWVALYCPDKFDLKNNTSNAVEQENARLKRIGARDMTIRHVIDELCGLVDRYGSIDSYRLGSRTARGDL